MAINHIEFFSNALGMRTRINVILPDNPTKKLKILLLYHGLCDDENVWLEQTNILSYVSDMQLAVIMPRVDRSYYNNLKSGEKYFDYASQEVLERCRKWFPLSDKKEDTFVGGISMGGFGALKAGLNHPETFSVILAMSAMTDLRWSWKNNPERNDWYKILFNSESEISNSENDLSYLISKQNISSTPYIWQLCGTEDPFYRINKELNKNIVNKKLATQFIEVPGIHEWPVWNRGIKVALDMLKERN